MEQVQLEMFSKNRTVYAIDDPRFEKIFRGASPLLVSRFLGFHQDNPDLYDMSKKFAFEAKSKGRERFSIWMIANRIRWYTQIETTGREFKVSNDYLACYARYLVYEFPEFEGFFKLKEMKPNRTVSRE